jgi:hypothetical protein
MKKKDRATSLPGFFTSAKNVLIQKFDLLKKGLDKEIGVIVFRLLLGLATKSFLH